VELAGRLQPWQLNRGYRSAFDRYANRILLTRGENERGDNEPDLKMTDVGFHSPRFFPVRCWTFLLLRNYSLRLLSVASVNTCDFMVATFVRRITTLSGSSLEIF